MRECVNCRFTAVGNCRVGKCPGGDLSQSEIVQVGKCLGAKLPRGMLSGGKLSSKLSVHPK